MVGSLRQGAAQRLERAVGIAGPFDRGDLKPTLGAPRTIALRLGRGLEPRDHCVGVLAETRVSLGEDGGEPGPSVARLRERGRRLRYVAFELGGEGRFERRGRGVGPAALDALHQPGGAIARHAHRLLVEIAQAVVVGTGAMGLLEQAGALGGLGVAEARGAADHVGHVVGRLAGDRLALLEPEGLAAGVLERLRDVHTDERRHGELGVLLGCAAQQRLAIGLLPLFLHQTQPRFGERNRCLGGIGRDLGEADEAVRGRDGVADRHAHARGGEVARRVGQGALETLRHPRLIAPELREERREHRPIVAHRVATEELRDPLGLPRGVRVLEQDGAGDALAPRGGLVVVEELLGSRDHRGREPAGSLVAMRGGLQGEQAAQRQRVLLVEGSHGAGWRQSRPHRQPKRPMLARLERVEPASSLLVAPRERHDGGPLGRCEDVVFAGRKLDGRGGVAELESACHPRARREIWMRSLGGPARCVERLVAKTRIGGADRRQEPGRARADARLLLEHAEGGDGLRHLTAPQRVAGPQHDGMRRVARLALSAIAAKNADDLDRLPEGHRRLARRHVVGGERLHQPRQGDSCVVGSGALGLLEPTMRAIGIAEREAAELGAEVGGVQLERAGCRYSRLVVEGLHCLAPARARHENAAILPVRHRHGGRELERLVGHALRALVFASHREELAHHEQRPGAVARAGGLGRFVVEPGRSLDPGIALPLLHERDDRVEAPAFVEEGDPLLDRDHLVIDIAELGEIVDGEPFAGRWRLGDHLRDDRVDRRAPGRGLDVFHLERFVVELDHIFLGLEVERVAAIGGRGPWDHDLVDRRGRLAEPFERSLVDALSIAFGSRRRSRDHRGPRPRLADVAWLFRLAHRGQVVGLGVGNVAPRLVEDRGFFFGHVFGDGQLLVVVAALVPVGRGRALIGLGGGCGRRALGESRTPRRRGRLARTARVLVDDFLDRVEIDDFRLGRLRAFCSNDGHFGRGPIALGARVVVALEARVVVVETAEQLVEEGVALGFGGDRVEDPTARAARYEPRWLASLALRGVRRIVAHATPIPSLRRMARYSPDSAKASSRRARRSSVSVKRAGLPGGPAI
jgi:hypothetical protein